MGAEEHCDSKKVEKGDSLACGDWGDVKSDVRNPSNKEKDLYTALITEAPYIPGDASDLVPLEEIPWFDKSLIEHGLEFHKRNATFVILSTTFALMYGFSIKPNSAVLVRTGKLHNPELSFNRYLSTIQRIAKFVMVFMQEEKSYKSLEIVRKMHHLASKKRNNALGNLQKDSFTQPWMKDMVDAMRKDFEHIDTSEAPKHLLTWDPPVPVSQFDMALTQFGFIGTMFLFPGTFGIKDRDEELKGMIHLWAVFGRLLGIKDEYNVCIKPDPALYETLFRNIVVESLKTMDETVVTIQSAFVDAFSKRLPFMTYKAMMYFGMRELKEYRGEHLWKLMSFWDKLSLVIMIIWTGGMRNCLPYRYLVNATTAIWLQIQFWLNLSTSLWGD